MFNNAVKLLTLCCALLLPSDDASAQPGRGGSSGKSAMGRGGQMGRGGGGMCSGGNGMNSSANGSQTMTNALRAFQNSADSMNLSNQMRMMQSQKMRSCQNNGAATSTTNATNSQRRPTVAQFVQAAKAFDRDGDGDLNEDELNQVATAVVIELQRRHQMPSDFLGNPDMTQEPNRPFSSLFSANEVSPQQRTAFVSKALTYDRDNDGMLNPAEVRSMATALIRSLG